MATQEKTIQLGELEWFYRDAIPLGESNQTPVLLLHGIPAQSYSWSPVLATLADKGLRAIAPDWPGFGYSSKPKPASFGYTPDAFVQALADWIQALKLQTFSLVVQGFLGSVGLQYALRHPDQVERLAIVNTPVSTAARLPWRLQQLGWPVVGEMLTQDPLLVDRTLEGGSRYTVPDKDLDVYRRPFLKTSAAGRSLLATIRRLQLKSALAEIETGLRSWSKPTLIIWGMNDPWLPFEQAQQLANSLPEVEVVRLPDAGHYPQEHWSEDVGSALQGFLRRQRVV